MHVLKRFALSMVAFTVTMAGSPAVAHGLFPIAMARSYSGSYPVTITNTGHGTYTGCLTLNASGSASLVLGGGKFPYGSYVVDNKIFVATIQAQGYGQNAGMLFIAPAGRILDQGAYEEVYGGENFLSGDLAFGAKGGC